MINNDGKLGPVRSPVTVSRIAAQSKVEAPAAASKASAATGASSLQIIAMAQQLSNQPPPVDAARVAELRRAVANGTYRIETIAIAQAMIDHAVAKAPQ